MAEKDVNKAVKAEAEAEVRKAVKAEAEAEVKPAAPVDMELVKALAEKMAKEMVKEMAGAPARTAEEQKTSAEEARRAYLTELVPYNYPYIFGEPEDITVKVAGEPLYRLMCGEDVMIPRYVAMILDTKKKMLVRARRYERAHDKKDKR